jgi:hypothetical protein
MPLNPMIALAPALKGPLLVEVTAMTDALLLAQMDVSISRARRDASGGHVLTADR